MTVPEYTETDALKLALDAAGRKRGRTAAWMHTALAGRPARTEPEPARLTGAGLINALHGQEAEGVQPVARLSGVGLLAAAHSTPGEADEASDDEAP